MVAWGLGLRIKFWEAGLLGAKGSSECRVGMV